jgi:hypothetical protein
VEILNCRVRSLYGWTLGAEVTTVGDAVLLLRMFVTDPPSTSSVYGCMRSGGPLGPLPMMGSSLVAQFHDHRGAVKSAHVAALLVRSLPPQPPAPWPWTELAVRPADAVRVLRERIWPPLSRRQIYTLVASHHLSVPTMPCSLVIELLRWHGMAH